MKRSPLPSRRHDMTTEKAEAVGIDREGSTARTEARTPRVLPIIVPPSATPDTIAQALKARGIPVAVYDFIKHNLGIGAALTACLTAEPRP